MRTRFGPLALLLLLLIAAAGARAETSLEQMARCASRLGGGGGGARAAALAAAARAAGVELNPVVTGALGRLKGTLHELSAQFARLAALVAEGKLRGAHELAASTALRATAFRGYVDAELTRARKELQCCGVGYGHSSAARGVATDAIGRLSDAGWGWW